MYLRPSGEGGHLRLIPQARRDPIAWVEVRGARATKSPVIGSHPFKLAGPVRRYLRYLVTSGYLGELRLVAATVLEPLGTDPSTRVYYWDWLGLRSEGGGMLSASLMDHHVDLLRYTFGEIDRVGGSATTLVKEKPVIDAAARGDAPLGPGTPTTGT